MKRRSVGGTSRGSALVVDVSRKVFIVKGGGALDRNLLFEQFFFFSDSKAPPEERHNCGGRGLVGQDVAGNSMVSPPLEGVDTCHLQNRGRPSVRKELKTICTGPVASC